MNRFVDQTSEPCLQMPYIVRNMFVWFAGQHLVIATQEGRTLKVCIDHGRPEVREVSRTFSLGVCKPLTALVRVSGRKHRKRFLAASHRSDASCEMGSGGTEAPEFRAELGAVAAGVLWLWTGSRRAGCGAVWGASWGLQQPG